MASDEELPDFDTTDVRVLAYWNIIEHGATSLEPGTIVTYSDVSTYTPYLNGIEGELSNNYANKSRTVHFRIKTDGWILAWIESTDTNDSGIIDVVDDHTNPANINQLPQTVLTSALQRIANNMTTSGTWTFNHGDVGHDILQNTNAKGLLMGVEQNSTTSSSATHKHTGGTVYSDQITPITHYLRTAYSGDGAPTVNASAYSGASVPNEGITTVSTIGVGQDAFEVHNRDYRISADSGALQSHFLNLVLYK